jgi:hypothetical protein
MDKIKPEIKANGHNFLDIVVFPKLDVYFLRKQDSYFYLSFILLLFFGILLFNVRISEGGDDSGYLLEAKRFIDGIAFPSFHGTFYAIFLGLLMKVFGFHLILLKMLSLAFLLGHQTLTYFTFRNRISPFILVTLTLIISVSNGILYFGSQTYTESFYMLFQASFFYIFIIYFNNISNNLVHIKSNWYKYLLLGFILFVLATTRNLGIGALIAIIFLLIIEKKFLPALFSLLAFLFFNIPYFLYKRFVWGITNSDISGQVQIALQKNPYNKAYGNEDLYGLLIRIIQNIKIYLSGIFFKETGVINQDRYITSLLPGVILLLILCIGFGLVFKNKKNLFRIIFLYLFISLSITFIALHQMWSQSRLIIILIPIMLICSFWTLGELSKNINMGFLRYIIILFLSYILIKETYTTLNKVSVNREILLENLSGNKYYGYTPDMMNYLRLSEWSAKNIPPEDKIGCRKASMSFIYGNGRIFYPIYKLPYINAVELLESKIKEDKQIYFIKENDFAFKPLKLVLPIKKFLYAIIYLDKSKYGMYLIDKKLNSQIETLLNDLKITPLKSIDEFEKNIFVNNKQKLASIPEELISELKRNDIKYLISANLRVQISEKSNATINAVELIMSDIYLKYPGIFIKVKQIGNNNNEPAILYKIDYKKYNIH